MVEKFGKYYMLMFNQYDTIKKQFTISYRRATGEAFDEDIFHDTLVKCAEILTEECMKDMSEESLINYTYIAFKKNMLREKNYARNKYRVTLEIDKEITSNDSNDYWDMRCKIKDFIIKNYDEKTFEECCQWIIDRKSVQEIEDEFDDKNLYYKFKKIKQMIVDKFGKDLHDIPDR